MSHGQPKVSIIILNYQGLSSLGPLLDEAIFSAIEQDYPDVEVLFIDNGSSDESVSHVSNKYGNKVKVVRLGKNYGFCLGNNLAVAHSSPSAKYLLFMNPDVILAKDYVRKLVDYLEKNPSVAIIHGLGINPLTGKGSIGGFLNLHGGYSIIEVFTRSFPCTCYNILIAFGAAMLVRKDVFKRAGMFPAEFFMYSDEADLGFRIWAMGYRILGTNASSYQHYVSGITSKHSSLSMYYILRNRLLLIIRYFYGKELIKALLWCIIYYIAGLTIKSIKSKFRVRLILRAVDYIIKNLKHELRHRLKWQTLIKARWRLLKCFLVKSNVVYI